MGKAKVAITLDEDIVRHLDYLVGQRAFKSRSQVIQQAVTEKLERLSRGRLARECALLDPVAEQESAEEGLAEDAKTWPEYREETSAGRT